MASEIQGIEELTRKLSELGAAAGGKALRSALFTASLPVLRSIQAAAPVGTKGHWTKRSGMKTFVAPGFLRRNIRRKSLLSRNKQFAIVLVGPASPAYYAQFIERGKTGYSPHPFMEQAFFASSQQAVDRFTERLKVLIDKARR